MSQFLLRNLNRWSAISSGEASGFRGLWSDLVALYDDVIGFGSNWSLFISILVVIVELLDVIIMQWYTVAVVLWPRPNVCVRVAAMCHFITSVLYLSKVPCSYCQNDPEKKKKYCQIVGLLLFVWSVTGRTQVLKFVFWKFQMWRSCGSCIERLITLICCVSASQLTTSLLSSFPPSWHSGLFGSDVLYSWRDRWFTRQPTGETPGVSIIFSQLLYFGWDWDRLWFKYRRKINVLEVWDS